MEEQLLIDLVYFFTVWKAHGVHYDCNCHNLKSLGERTDISHSNLLSTIALHITDIDLHWKTSSRNTVKGNRSLQTMLSATEQFRT
jgi:hypothetical protein